MNWLIVLFLLLGFAPARASYAVPPADTANGDYGGYFTWPEVRQKIAGWKKDYPRLVHAGALGKTFEGREIPLFRLSDDAEVKPGEPEILLMAGIHPREQQPQVALLRLVDELLAGYGKDERLTHLLKDRQIWVIPVLNVDGKIYDMQKGDGKARGADWRKNRHPNGHGTIGIDLNRNFAVRWGGFREIDPLWQRSTSDADSDIYEGPEPFSEPETRLLAEFITSRPHLRAFIDLHSPLRKILYPTYLTVDETKRFERLAKGMQSLQQDRPYPTTEPKPDGEPKAGIRSGNTGLTYHWAYYTQGVYAFNFEMSVPSDTRLEAGRYPSIAEIDAEYKTNIREPLLFFLEASGNLPLVQRGKATFVEARIEGKATPGATISWTPTIEGPCAYAVVVSETKDVVVQSEFRLVPVKTGFTLQIQKDVKPGTVIPLTLHLWDNDRGHIVVKTSLTVE